MDIREVAESMEGKMMSMLKNRPIWAFWAVYSAFSGVFFGIFYTVTYLLALRWWVAVLVMVAIGIIWGSFVYSKGRRAVKSEEES